mmetsp:Transcript_5234/g.12588  ORF Transcript_5234/g.12588 Transcript_5234/m.12588 type:complete len:180 (-) Transcript_5234:279-818(-)
MLGQACDLGDCEAGVDVATCEDELNKECGDTLNDPTGMLDSCGGHAYPYHYHKGLDCEYTASWQAEGHSPVIAAMLDGRGMYGKWESTGNLPADLDACNGHTGPVPASAEFGTAASTVYHYHMTAHPPFTVGCWGPVASLAECKGLYSECSDANEKTNLSCLWSCSRGGCEVVVQMAVG